MSIVAFNQRFPSVATIECCDQRNAVALQPTDLPTYGQNSISGSFHKIALLVFADIFTKARYSVRSRRITPEMYQNSDS